MIEKWRVQTIWGT